MALRNILILHFLSRKLGASTNEITGNSFLQQNKFEKKKKKTRYKKWLNMEIDAGNSNWFATRFWHYDVTTYPLGKGSGARRLSSKKQD